MDRTQITKQIEKLWEERRMHLEYSKTPNGLPSRSKTALKHVAKAEEITKAIKALTIPAPTENCAYDVPVEALASKTWRTQGFPEPPAIGTEVTITMNGLGEGTVVGYFFEHGFAGVIVMLYGHTQPAWHKRQTSGSWHEGHALVYGAEIKARS